MSQSGTCIATKCIPCRGVEAPYTREQIVPFLLEVSKWKYNEGVCSISCEIRCRNYSHAMDILNKVAVVAEREAHHPDHSLTKYRILTFTLTTHALHGLTMNDFVMAKLIDQAVAETL